MVSKTQFTLFSTPIGTCGIAWHGDHVVATRLPDVRPATTARYLATRQNASEGKPPMSVQDAIAAITTLLQGERTDLSFIACNLEQVDPFAAKVYAATQTVPPGKTSTYGAIASEISMKQDARKVGYALGHNPVPIVVPCHRVLGAGGRLTGFSAPGGVKLKLKMLEIEGADMGNEPGLFEDLPFSLKTPR